MEMLAGGWSGLQGGGGGRRRRRRIFPFLFPSTSSAAEEGKCEEAPSLYKLIFRSRLLRTSTATRCGGGRHGGHAMRVGAEQRPDPLPPCLPLVVARHSRARRHQCRIHTGSAATPPAFVQDMPHRSRIRARGARSGDRMCRRAASSPPACNRPSPPCPQPCCAGSADAAHAATRRWRRNCRDSLKVDDDHKRRAKITQQNQGQRADVLADYRARLRRRKVTPTTRTGFLYAPDSVDAVLARRNTGEESDPAVRRLCPRAAT
uniref:Uncharacterized protein n=1 Tax=Oryza rufipogon TaxID=4529 RepID=A0A0E0N851_ORYRU